MESIPSLQENQVALMRSELATGHVLDERFKLAVNTCQNVYTIFPSIEEAVSYAKTIMIERKDIEVVIYGANHEALKYLTPQNINSI